MTARYRHTDLIDCAATLFARAGLDEPLARAVADILVDADLLGYDSHGLQFVPAYLGGVEAGRWTSSGEPAVVKDGGATLLLDGRGLPGQWALLWALERARQRVADHGMVAVTLGAVQNVGCLATYVKRAADHGLLALLMASAPGASVVAPHGGCAGRFSTNPLALGIPAHDHPILIDTSASATSGRKVERHRRAGTRLPLPALVGADGVPSDDPAVLVADPPGAILPGGGADYGHKGFALALLVEAFTCGLFGAGRAQVARGGTGVGNTVYLQLVDPEAFGGVVALREETGFLATICRDTPPLAGGPPVRVPGDRAFAAYAEQLERGVALHPEILPRMEPALRKYDVPAPRPVT